jgi:(p)ppGpp synthase/HD superfamily hydrolase
MELYDIALNLIQTRIPGFRKGTDVPAYSHSEHVYDILVKYGLAEEICLAGLLHDVIEDGDTSLDELTALGFSDRTVALVSLCTHDMTSSESGDARWVKMIARLIEANDRAAWLIKLADLFDNAQSADTMSPARARFNKEVKVPLLLSVTKEVAGDHGIWKELADFYEKNG